MQPNLRSDRGAAGTAANDLRAFGALAAQIPERTYHLIIWPETVAPQDAIEDAETGRFFGAIAHSHGAYALVGTSHVDEKQHLHNSAAIFSPTGQLLGRYDKRWLVPMGEWVPLRNALPFGDIFHFPEETYPGTTNIPVSAGQIRMSVLICYESVFPVLSRIGVNEGANLLVNITNDSWAGESSELAQHLAMTTFRAVETRRYIASAATTGVTCAIEPNGRIHSIPTYKEGVLLQQVSLLQGRTIYVRIGDAFVGLCVLILGVLLVRGRQVAGAGSLT
jgi:apolipoprotein N-acyltransferase